MVFDRVIKFTVIWHKDLKQVIWPPPLIGNRFVVVLLTIRLTGAVRIRKLTQYDFSVSLYDSNVPNRTSSSNVGKYSLPDCYKYFAKP